MLPNLSRTEKTAYYAATGYESVFLDARMHELFFFAESVLRKPQTSHDTAYVSCLLLSDLTWVVCTAAIKPNI